MTSLPLRARSTAASRQRPLERYMAALETIAAANTSGLALTDLAQCCRLPAATTYRILQGLLDAKLIMVRPGRSNEYVVGLRCPIAVDGLGVQYAVAVTGNTKRLERWPVNEIAGFLRQAASELEHLIECGSREATTVKARQNGTLSRLE